MLYYKQLFTFCHLLMGGVWKIISKYLLYFSDSGPIGGSPLLLPVVRLIIPIYSSL